MAHVAGPAEYQATTNQACGLFPFVAGSGTPVAGTPVGRHQAVAPEQDDMLKVSSDGRKAALGRPVRAGRMAQSRPTGS